MVTLNCPKKRIHIQTRGTYTHQSVTRNYNAACRHVRQTSPVCLFRLYGGRQRRDFFAQKDGDIYKRVMRDNLAIRDDDDYAAIVGARVEIVVKTNVL